ncbi:hypothetical protein [Microbacterium sp.]|uniref:hypothetical protein n=1 Tax=Microbacterium TaxID=33882 RepID=UPI0025EE38E1|nr:hypothetical protein [uncultured Microbacterium sp.]
MASKWLDSAEKRCSALAARAEDEDYTPIEQLDGLAQGRSTTPQELDAIVSQLDTLPASVTPVGVTEGRASEDDLRELVALGGRPSLSGCPGAGPSPKRQVRLAPDLDALLIERMARDHRTASEIMRDALDAYLRDDA